MRYMIHSAPSRQWYVDDFLIPSMIEQGINKKEIIVRCDTEGKGNLFSCMDSFLWCGQHTDNGTWHLQDDIIISRDFAEKTKEYNNGIVCGFVVKEWGPDWTKDGVWPVKDMWYSFQCIHIPDKLAGECAVWFYSDASKRTDPKYYNRVSRRKHDDDFFQFFLLERHPELQVRNLAPNIVDHIDYMIGGTLINSGRSRQINRTAYWKDENIIRELDERLCAYWHKNNSENSK